MLKTEWQNCHRISTAASLLPIVGMVIMTATAGPVEAQVVINGGVSVGTCQSSAAAPFVYGSSIAPPVPVDPSTGQLPSQTSCTYSVPGNIYPYQGPGNVYSYPGLGNNAYSYPALGSNPYSYPVLGGNVYSYPVPGAGFNQTLLNPVLINPTLINPVIVGPGYGHRQFFHGYYR